LQFERAAQCMTIWPRVSVRDAKPHGTHSQLGIEFADPAGEAGRGGMSFAMLPALSRRPLVKRGEGSEVAPPERDLTTSLRRPWRFAAEEVDLKTLVEQLRAAGGPKVDIPEYARGRRVVVASSGTEGDVLGALCLLWRWE